ncbi:MAG: DUF1553 domain-containing protein [Planctomycetaceae bacterium]|nr:DUF1553 domain-containing protein [Planctomycetaceae bacterium]
MRSTIVRLTLSCLLLLFPALDAIAADDDGLEFFEKKIRPVLVKHCYECHSGESKALKGSLLVDSAPGLMKGGDSGPSLVKGKPEQSLLLEAMKYESFEMPPAGKLPNEIIADFEKWIALGAPDPRDEMIHHKDAEAGIDIEAGKQFWAFQPPEEHTVPSVQQTAWPKNWIDRFILAKLEENNLSPTAPADRATLLRRIAYDLTGLPPSPEEIEQYAYSDDPQEIVNYVDRLLDTQQFGEHWGRHWLDVARYADSNGGDFNATFHNAWRYRNYVINTFNQDRSYNDFVVEQIAGDLLDSSTIEERERNLVATGFLMFGAKMLSERDKEKLRMDVVDEQITSVGKAFMGMTLGCARCHDHKFDPIPTTDYYALAGIFRSTQTLDGEIQKYVSNWTRQPLPMTDEHKTALAEYQELTGDLKQKIKEGEARLKSLDSMSSKAQILKQGILLDDEVAEKVGYWKASTFSKNYIGKGYIHDDKQELGKKKVIFKTKVPKTEKYEIRLAFPGSGGRASNVPVTITQGDFRKTINVDETKQAPILTMLKPLGQFELNADQEVVVEIANNDTNGYVIVDALQIVSVEELKEEAETDNSGVLAEIETLKKEIDSLKSKLKDAEQNAPPPAPLALAVKERETPGDYFVCIRGEHQNLGDRVSRGFLTVANYEGAPQVSKDESGRLELAEWIADARHPLTARVYVNRVWHHLMGAGIVRSVDNFGKLGERPTHPLLLDQLAVEFIEHDWSTKWLVREIVLSQTYQQSTKHDDDKWQADPENRLLWRMHRKPLPAEAIRDTMLLATGELSFEQGGPPVDNLGTLVTQNNPNDKGVTLESTNIRTMYQPIIRNELPTLMRVFDFADPDFVTGKRPETTVPSQALWMLNSPFMAEQAMKVSRRVLVKQFSTESESLEYLYLITIGRPPTEKEIELATHFLQANDTGPAANWADLAHALLASTASRMLD